MDLNELILIIIIFFSSFILIITGYYEYNLNKCEYDNIQLQKKKGDIFQSQPILKQETNLEHKFDESPFDIYKDYFDQPSPWIGTVWSGKQPIKRWKGTPWENKNSESSIIIKKESNLFNLFGLL